MAHPRMRWLVAGALLAMLVPMLAACGGSGGSGSNTPTAKKIKVGLVTDIGGLNDKGFNHLADVGLEMAKSQLGIQGDVVESHSGNDYVPNLTNFATKGYDLVIGVGFLMQAAVGQVAGQFPHIHFAIIDGAGTDANGNDLKLPNVESLLFKEQDAGALVGVIAGTMEKSKEGKKNTNVISAVGGVSIPPVNRYIAGYKWAATMADSSIKVLVGYSNDFTDPTKCAGVANSQIQQGADFVFQVAGGCGLGALTAAGKAGVYSFGVDTDQSTADPSVIASAVKRVDVATFTAIKQVHDGSFTGGVMTFGLDNGGVGYAPGTVNIPQDAQAAETALAAAIKAGTQTPPDTIQ